MSITIDQRSQLDKFRAVLKADNYKTRADVAFAVQEAYDRLDFDSPEPRPTQPSESAPVGEWRRYADNLSEWANEREQYDQKLAHFAESKAELSAIAYGKIFKFDKQSFNLPAEMILAVKDFAEGESKLWGKCAQFIAFARISEKLIKALGA